MNNNKAEKIKIHSLSSPLTGKISISKYFSDLYTAIGLYMGVVTRIDLNLRSSLGHAHAYLSAI